jgi:undecaprenyl-diphosphatase
MNIAPVPAPDSSQTALAEPPPLWVYVATFCALLALGWAFGETALIARNETPDGLDVRLVAWATQHHRNWPYLDAFFHLITRLGNFEVALPSTLFVAAVLVLLGRNRVARLRKREAIFWLGVIAGGRMLCVILKLLFQRERPPVAIQRVVIGDLSFSFPSGHSMYAAVFFTLLGILFGRLLADRPAWTRWLAWAPCALAALLVGFSRVWLGVHYPSDVMGGLALGVGWVLLVYLIRFGWRTYRVRRMRPRA